MDAGRLRPRRVGEVLDAGIKIYVSNARTLMGLAAVVVVPMQLLAAVVLLSAIPSGRDVPSFRFSVRPAGTPDPSAVLGAQAILIVVQVIAGALVTAACVKAVSEAYVEHPTSIGASLRFALRRLPAVLVMEVVMVFGLILGFAALIIPGVRLYGLWSVSTPALMIERVGPIRGLGRSRRLVRGRWWATAGVLLISTVMVGLVSTVLQALLGAVESTSSQPSLLLSVVVATLSGAVSGIIAEPFRAAVTTVLYYDLRVRQEGYDLQVLADQLGLPELSSAEVQAERVEATRHDWPSGPESVGKPGGPPFWPPPPGWTPGT